LCLQALVCSPSLSSSASVNDSAPCLYPDNCLWPLFAPLACHLLARLSSPPSLLTLLARLDSTESYVLACPRLRLLALLAHPARSPPLLTLFALLSCYLCSRTSMFALLSRLTLLHHLLDCPPCLLVLLTRHAYTQIHKHTHTHTHKQSYIQ
jgi:hypothetical protein